MKRCLNCFQLFDDSLGDTCTHCGFANENIENRNNSLFRGTVLDNGRYIIGETQNSGGFGVVYKAFDTKLELIVAIKEYFPGNLSTRMPGTCEVIAPSGKKKEHFDRGKENFIYEARIMMKFEHHDNIVNCLNYFEENNTAYIVMEFLEGCTIKEFIAMNSLDVQSVEEISLAVMNALESVHQAGFIFRDVAPDNIFLCSNGNIKLIDFGAAIPIGKKIEGMYEDTIIKPGYAPIEQYASNGKMGAYTDIYALGATIYRMLSGQVPYESTDRDEYDDQPILKSFNEEIPEYIDKAVMKAIAVQPKLRFKSIDEFRQAFKHEKDIEYINEFIKKRKKLRKLIFASIGALVVLLSGIIIYIYQSSSTGIKNITVSEDTISVMMPYQKEEDKKYFEDIVSNFNEEYPNIHVNLQMVTQENYNNELLNNEVLPNVFLSNNLVAEERLGNMEELLLSLNKNNYFAFNGLEKESLQYAIPLSFEASVCFVNTSLISSEEETVFIDEVIKDYKLAYNKKFALTIKEKEKADENYAKYQGNITDKNAFLMEQTPYYVGSSMERKEIAEKLAGYWDIYAYENQLAVNFLDSVSIAKTESENQMNASMLFVYQLLSDFSQNRMYLQINSGKMPVNKSTLDMYLTSYKQLDFIDDLTDIIVYTKEDIFKNTEMIKK